MSMENLSNEVFYEIFEYLEGCQIFKAFSNLNDRFQQLINSSSLLLNFNFCRLTTDEQQTNIYKHLLINNKHQILSLALRQQLSPKNEFFSSFSIDLSFDRLESLDLYEIEPMILLPLLTNLASLPRLFSLTINMQRTFDNLDKVYQLIFALPKLKYINCSAERYSTIATLPFATGEQLTVGIIEYISIDHDCTFNELCTLISYTPQLRHLDMTHLSRNYSNEETILPFTCPNLTYLSIDLVGITFDELEMFIIDTECNLKVLRMDFITDDRDYLDADKWEELIVNYLPELKEFYFQYHQAIDPESGWLTDFEPPNQFNSLFWNDRKWVLEVEMHSFDYLYSIHSYEKRWYDVDSPDDDHMMQFNLIIRDLLIITQIYHLEISIETICSDVLMDFIYKLSALDTSKYLCNYYQPNIHLTIIH